jgi:hypothetical protein
MTTTETGVVTNESSQMFGDAATANLSVDETAEAFLKRWEDPEKVSEGDKGANDPQGEETSTAEDVEDEETEETEQTDDDQSNEADDDGEQEEDTEDTETEEVKVADDDVLVKITVDGEEKTVSVKELKRLYGQEASLTRKSQEIAEKRKAAEEEGAKYVTGIQTLLQRAYSRYEPYSKIDFLVASKELSTEEFSALRQEAQKAYEDVQFLQSELDGVLKTTQERQSTLRREAAAEAVRVLSDPKTGIPNWSPEVYDEIRMYAIGSGLPAEQVNNYVDPTVIKILYKAMMNDKTKAVATEKKAKAPQKVLKPSNGVNPKSMNDAKRKAQNISKLRSGDADDIASVILSRWEK